MRKYEIMYIVNASLDDAKRVEVIENLHGIITNNGGSVKDVKEWGLKDFAYPIENMTKGYYVVVNFEIGTEGLAEFDRLIGINSNVVRYMIVNCEEIKGDA